MNLTVLLYDLDALLLLRFDELFLSFEDFVRLWLMALRGVLWVHVWSRVEFFKLFW